MKKFAINLLIAITSFLISCALAEMAARFLLPEPQWIRIEPIPPVTPVPTIAHLSLREHPDEGGVYRGTPTGRRLQANRRVTIENHRLSRQQVLIETNSLGYRNREIGPKQGKRILFLGDSVTFQDYLNEADTFVRQVEQKARANGQDWETINAAVGAISLKTELAILEESGIALQPDVVVLGFYLNDFQESKGVQIVQLPWLLQHSYFAYHAAQWLNQQRGQHLPDNELHLKQWKTDFARQQVLANAYFNESPAAFNQMLLDNFADYGAAWSPLAWQHMRPLFMELKRLSQQQRFQLVIVAFPLYQQVYTEFVSDLPQQQLQQIGAELHIPVLDLLPAFRQAALQRRDPSIYHGQRFYDDLFYDQCHHTPAGSALVADQIFQFLQQQAKD